MKNNAPVKFEEYERERLDEIYSRIDRYSAMSKNERYFLNGIIRYFKPRKILEVGTARGGGSAIILNAIKDLPDSQLISTDYCEKYYMLDTDKPSGYVIGEQFPQFMDKWTLYAGGDISRYIEKIGDNIDVLVLDTAHIHPWETLNFLCILPFMKVNASWCVLHDVSLPYVSGREECLACRYLYGHVVSDVKTMPAPDYIPHFSNIAAFRITDDTVKYAGNLFESLLAAWAVPPSSLNNDLHDIRAIVRKYYPDYAEFFEHAIEYQQGIFEHKEKYYRSFSGTLKRIFPLSYALWEKIHSTYMNNFLKFRAAFERSHPSAFEKARRLRNIFRR